MRPMYVGRYRIWLGWFWRCRRCRVESLPLVSWQVAYTGALDHCARGMSCPD